MPDLSLACFWAILPDGLEGLFDVEAFEKTETHFRVTLLERNIVPDPLPPEYRGKRIVNTVLKSKLIEYFPLKGRKTEITLKRRYWRFDGVPAMLTRTIEICAEGTHLEKEFAAFLKEIDRI